MPWTRKPQSKLPLCRRSGQPRRSQRFETPMNAAAPQAAQAAPSNVSILAERCSGDLDVRTRARRVAEVAARHAPDVDQEGRVPAEAIAALKAERLMGVL